MNTVLSIPTFYLLWRPQLKPSRFNGERSLFPYNIHCFKLPNLWSIGTCLYGR
jgi:hypothetical protein